MERTKPSIAKFTFGLITCLTAWFGIILQFYLTTGSALNFFSYFTILTNLLIAVSLTFSLLLTTFKPAGYFNLLPVQTAIALYIFVVAVVYNTVLRGILKLMGWSFFVDNVLHVVVPALYLVYWLIFIPKGKLQIKDGVYWLLFPAVYLGYSLIRGSFVNWYPYPFLNASKLGYPQVIINITVMLGVFLITGFLFVVLKRETKKAVEEQAEIDISV